MMNRNAQRALLVAIVFTAALWGGDRLLSLGLQKVMSLSSNRFVSLYEGRYGDGVVVLGNSRADRHFPAQQLSPIVGMPVVNLGLGGESTVLSELLLRDYVDRNGAPRLLIIEPTNMMTDPTEVGDMRLFGVYSDRLAALTHEQGPNLYYTAELFHLFYFNNEMFFRVLMGIVRTEKDRRHHGVIPERLVERLRGHASEAVNHYPANEQALMRMLAFAESQGIEVCLVVTPYFSEHKVTGQDNMGEWLTWLQTKVGEKRRVHNYARAPLGRESFRDTVHLNARGVDELFKMLEQDGVFAGIK